MFYIYAMKQQINIYKCVQLHIIILRQHVSVTHVTIIRVCQMVNMNENALRQRWWKNTAG